MRILKTAVAIAGLLVLVMTTRAGATTITFDDGIVGNSVGSTYAALGVTFQNATYSPFGGLPGGTPPTSIDSTSSNTFIGEGDLISATFSTPVVSVSLTGLDVGGAGFLLRGFDALVGGNLVDSQSVYGSGLGVGQFFTLSLSGSNIQRIEFFQPSPCCSDGIAFDNLTFQAVPEPGSLLLLGTGLAAVVRRVKSRRHETA